MIKECIYEETEKISLREAAEFYYYSQMLGITPQYDEAYASHMEKIMEVRNSEIGAHLPDGKYPLLGSAMMGIGAYKNKPVVICEVE